jgi:recombination protein RecT
MANTSISKAVNAVSNPAPVIPFEQAIESAMLSVKTSIPNHIDFNIALQMFKNLRSKNPALASCTKESLIGAMLTASELGLMPVNQQVYFIPYFNNKKNVMECQLQIGYQGMVDLFYRSDRAISVDAKAVREKDTFEYDDGLNPTLTYKPCLKGLPGETYGYYAVAKLKDEGIKIVYMTKDEVMIHAKQFCKAIDKNGNFTGPWGTNFDEMAKKTVLKKLFKVLPKSINLEKALEVDEGVKEYRPGVKTMFALPAETDVHNAENVVEADYTMVEPEYAPEPAENTAQEAPKQAEKPAPAKTPMPAEKVAVNGKEAAKTGIEELLSDTNSLKDKVLANKDVVLAAEVVGFVREIEETQTTTGKPQTAYRITDESQFFAVQIKVWGHGHNVLVDQKVIVKNVTGYVAKNGALYLSAKSIEAV